MAKYLYMNAQGKQCGPVEETQLAACGVTPSTLVWCRGMRNWQPASEVIDITILLSRGGEGNVPEPPQPPFTDPKWPLDEGNKGPKQPPRQRPDNYLTWAIIVTICCCCWPAGIVALVFANKVNKYWDAGEYDNADKASKQAKTWCIITACVGGFSIISLFILTIILGLFGL